MNFFLKLNWKFSIRSIIFYASFVLTCSGSITACMAGTNEKVYNSVDLAAKSNMPVLIQNKNKIAQAADSFKQKINSDKYSTAEVKTEKERLRECLANVLLNAEKKENAQEKVRLSVAGALSNDNCEGLENQANLDILRALKNSTYQGSRLIEKIFAFCKYMDDEISNLKVSNAEKVKLKVRIDELKRSAENFGLLVSQPAKKEVQHKKYRILDVSDSLQVVVISAGYLDGVRPGLILNIARADNAVIRVIATRPFVSAAIVIEGKLGKISPGMSVRLSK